ncbi:MAG: hypothetical protein EHM24_11215 [Acidobacteria bacterium]|nr:MAG: hypothetical protein EHM24_11215 [Acidobacteriota bacterium]
MKGARCLEPGAPSPFPDDWGTGRAGRAARSRALAQCRTCPAQVECAEGALADYEAGLPMYGIRGGVAFTDVSRPEGGVKRLRQVAAP